MVTARLVLRTSGGQRIAVDASGVSIGRDPHNRIVVEDRSVSRHHAKVLVVDNELVIHDQGSINGTFLNNHRITGAVNLQQGDEVRVGTYLIYIEPAPVDATGALVSAQRRMPPPAIRRNLRGNHLSWPRSQRTVVILAAAGLATLGLLAIPVFTNGSSPQPTLTQSTPTRDTPGAEPSNTSADWADVFQRVARDVVVITNATDQGTGTGVYFDADHVITNAHVVATARAVEVTLLPVSGRGGAVSQMATVRARDSQLDLAVLTLAQPGTPHVAFGSPQDVRVGDEVMAIGEPLGLAWTATFGRVSAFRRGTEFGRPAVETIVQFDASVNPGNSGGPLLTHSGKVIGLVTFGGIRSGAQGLNFAIAGDQLWTQARQWIARGSAK